MGYARERIALRDKRIEEAILKDLTLTNQQLAERFNCGPEVLHRIRKKIHVLPPSSEYVTQGDFLRVTQTCKGFGDNVFHFGHWKKSTKSS